MSAKNSAGSDSWRIKLIVFSGITLEMLFKLLKRNRVSFSALNMCRLLVLFFSGWGASSFMRLEKMMLRSRIDALPVPQDPIFLIGHWRTGSTFLHQLMAQNPLLAAPTLLHVGFPDSFIFSQRFVAPMIQRMFSRVRPMDQVAITLDEPQEDESALFRMTTISPLERLFFPKTAECFLLDPALFEMDPASARSWEQAIQLFCKKMHFATGKQIVLKNPFHSMRIKMLARLFPKACFIHIYRHPYAVVPSTVRMWSVMGELSSMNDKWKAPGIADAAVFFERMLSAIRHDLADLPRNRYCEVRFEDLEKDPVLVLRSIYNQLALSFTPEYEEKLAGFLSQIKKYKKNTYSPSTGDRLAIYTALQHHMAHYGYS